MINTLRRAVLTLVSAALILGTGAASVRAVTPISIEAYLYSACTFLHSDPTALGSVSQLTSTGSVVETKEAAFNASGDASVCFDQPFYAGMKVQATTGGVTRTLTLPKLGLSVDRTTDVIRGTAPAGKQVKVTVTYDPTYTDPTGKTFTRTASSTGTWSVDTTSSFNLLGGDGIRVTWTNGTDIVYRMGWVPRVTVRIGSAKASATINPGQGGTITLKNSAGTVRGRAAISGPWWAWDSIMDGSFIDGAGSAVAARVGDRVSAPFQPSMAFTIPQVTVSANASTNTVSGTCPANRRMHIRVWRSGAENTDWVKCSAAGTYNHVMDLGFDVQSGDRVLVTVRLSAGDLVQRLRMVP